MREHVITMTERPGHFEQGRWVEEPAAPVQSADPAAIEQRLARATKAVITSIDAMAGVTRDLVATPEGKQYVEKTLAETRGRIENSFDTLVRQLKDELDKRAGR